MFNTTRVTGSMKILVLQITELIQDWSFKKNRVTEILVHNVPVIEQHHDESSNIDFSRSESHALATHITHVRSYICGTSRAGYGARRPIQCIISHAASLKIIYINELSKYAVRSTATSLLQCTWLVKI